MRSVLATVNKRLTANPIMMPKATLEKLISIYKETRFKSPYQSCHARMAEPRQKPTAVSLARIGVLTALMPIPKDG